MDRWIQMHYQIKERELALEISRSRELFFWLGSFYTVTLMGIVSRYKSCEWQHHKNWTNKSFSFRYRTTRRSGVLAPVVPLSFVLAYYADLAYGSKVHRIRGWFDGNRIHVMLRLIYFLFQNKSRSWHDNAKWIRFITMAARTTNCV